MPKFSRFDPRNKRKGRNKLRSKLGLNNPVRMKFTDRRNYYKQYKKMGIRLN